MHKQDQIPFYLAGTLSPAEAAALERHLAECESCRHALEEWRLIANIVHTEADHWARSAPPLAPRVRAGVAMSAEHTARANGHRPNAANMGPAETIRRVPDRFRHVSGRRLRQPVSLAAALLVVTFAGALLLWIASRGSNGATGSSVSSTPIGTFSGKQIATATPTPSSTPAIDPSSTAWDLGIIPQPTATNTAPSPATDTPGYNPPTATIAPDSSLTPDQCYVYNPTATSVTIQRWPGINQAVTDSLQPGEFRRTVVQSGDGWLQVMGRSYGIAGWVLASQVQLYGPCDSLVTPSPTPAYTTEPWQAPCILTAADSAPVNLRAGPGDNYDLLTAFGPGQNAPATARSNTGWFQVQVIVDSTPWSGWVPNDEVIVSGDCAALPVIITGGVSSETSPTTTPQNPLGFSPSESSDQ